MEVTYLTGRQDYETFKNLIDQHFEKALLKVGERVAEAYKTGAEIVKLEWVSSEVQPWLRMIRVTMEREAPANR